MEETSLDETTETKKAEEPKQTLQQRRMSAKGAPMVSLKNATTTVFNRIPREEENETATVEPDEDEEDDEPSEPPPTSEPTTPSTPTPTATVATTAAVDTGSVSTNQDCFIYVLIYVLRKKLYSL